MVFVTLTGGLFAVRDILWVLVGRLFYRYKIFFLVKVRIFFLKAAYTADLVFDFIVAAPYCFVGLR